MPTKFAEVIYETGSHSVVSFDNEAELIAGLNEQHRRAINGEVGGPVGHPAERVKRVIVYDDHPGADNYSIGTEAIKTLVDGMAQNDQLNAHQLISAIRDETSSVYPVAQGRHASQYKAEGTELANTDALWLSGSGGGE